MDNVITRSCSHCGQVAWRIAQFTGYDVYECPSGHKFNASLNPPECWQSTEYTAGRAFCAGGDVEACSPPQVSVAISAEGGT